MKIHPLVKPIKAPQKSTKKKTRDMQREIEKSRVIQHKCSMPNPIKLEMEMHQTGEKNPKNLQSLSNGGGFGQQKKFNNQS